MTRKNYVAIAEILLSARKEFGNRTVLGEQVIHCIEADLAAILLDDNARFDIARFQTASREAGWTPAITRKEAINV